MKKTKRIINRIEPCGAFISTATKEWLSIRIEKGITIITIHG